jgi:hypothetical protein
MRARAWEQAVALQEFTVEDFKDGRGEDASARSRANTP